MSVKTQVIQTAISTLVQLMGQGHVFTRIKDEIIRTNTTLPNATGHDKKMRVLSNLKIIFEDLVEPVAVSVLNLLIELGVAWMKAQHD